MIKKNDPARIWRNSDIFCKWKYILVCEGGHIYWRASKHSRSRKMIPAKQYAAKSLQKGHGIDFGDYAQLWLVSKFMTSQTR